MKASRIVSIHLLFIKHIEIQKVSPLYWRQSLLILEFQILDDDNSSQNLDDEDLAQLILEAEADENEESDEVYSSWHLFVLSIAKGITTIISVFMNFVQNLTLCPV